MEYTVINNEKQMQFEIHEGDAIAHTEYRFYKKNIAFMHTVVPESMKNKGVGSALAAFAFQYAKEIEKQVMVYCPFVSSYMKRHPEVRVQLDKEFHQGI
ncbi:MAG: GNAT family N-acetyltransferase [Bacteroidota bacterium]